MLALSPHARLRRVLLPSLLASTLAAQPSVPVQPRAGVDALPAYIPITGRGYRADQLLLKQAAWIRQQVWSSGPLTSADSFLFPRSYDVTSGYGNLGSGFFTWMLEHNDAYFQFDASHNSHRGDVPLDHSNDAAIERVMMAWGANAYDTASWAVAMAAALRCHQFSPAAKADFGQALNAYLRFLLTSSYPGGLTSYKAWDPAGALRWSYGESGQDPTQGQGRNFRFGYYWQHSPPRWQNPDPAWDAQAQPGTVMNWPGWSAITGEEAWVAFLGPLQVAYSQNPGRPGWAAASSPVAVPPLVENACRALPAVALMQNSATGGLYRDVRPPNSPDDPKWFATSLENNWSMYTGLGFLERALLDLRVQLPNLPQKLEIDLEQALADTRAIRAGMLRFFKNKALVWHAKGEPFGDPRAVPYGFFLQGTVGRAEAAQGFTAAFATDVQTWGIAAILADPALERELEAVYGASFLDDMFQAAVELAGYYGPGGTPLLGVGFNAQRAGDLHAQMSGEWTWGAINAAIVLADFHRQPEHADPARVRSLLATARSLIQGVQQVCSHDYNPNGDHPDMDWVGYLYSNRREWIPWGWYGNPCPSQAATTWAFRVNAGFNAFELGGGEHQATVRELGLAGR